MVTEKFIVLLFFIVSCACYSKYCEICTNHILCQYSTPGPSVTCKEYDRNNFLTDDDIYDLVNQINERRNFIALGHSGQLPSAANMNKIVWSEELATFAQRWVDQCDPSLRPDKEDQCRDLELTNVGQNIASIVNPSPTFNVKSFVEMWFIHLLEYKGSVTYYDKFQDYISNYFTQLIWAETENVGCGRAKFKVNNVTVDRIVCNFSPQGNIQGKPIYIIGYPGTQCQNQATEQDEFKGLCTQSFSYKTKLPAENLPVSSLLRILNLSNDSVRQDIDPIYNNMKQIIQQRSEMKSPKQPIIRHISGKKSQSKRTDLPHRQAINFWENPINVSRDYKEHLHNRQNSYSRVDHSQFYKYTDKPMKHGHINDFRKHVINVNSDDDYGNLNNMEKQCTRSTETSNRDCENSLKTPLSQKVFKCTRGLKTNWQMLQNTQLSGTSTIPHEMCPCSIHTNTGFPSTKTQRIYTLNCQCINANGLTIRCPNLLRTLKNNARIENDALEDEISFKDTYINTEDENEWLYNKRRKNKPQSKRSGYFFSNRNRHKRDLGESSTFKPFWQIDNFSNEENLHLKALRYTTLLNRRKQKTKRYPSKLYTTETITIKLKNTHIKPVTEKYLSFDELLHLRKFNLSGVNAKRRMEPQILRNPEEENSTTVVTEATTQLPEENVTEYTANTPYVRIKHCTRKLTCTWTAAALTDSNGSVVGDRDHGSRTPPGYVEGCTRTSTCTRDYMNRNKFPTTITSSTDDGDDDANDNSDYCERRSLNLHKRKTYRKRSFSKYHQHTNSNTDIIRFMNSKDIKDLETLRSGNFRKKRDLIKQNNLSYGDLYYLVLSKIVKEWKSNSIHHNKCPCNIAIKRHNHSYIILLFYYFVYVFFKSLYQMF